MRKNTVETFKAWQARKPKRIASSIWTDGSILYSYSTPILWREGERVLFNTDRYSPTTSNHQNGIRFLMSQNRIGWEHKDNG